MNDFLPSWRYIVAYIVDVLAFCTIAAGLVPSLRRCLEPAFRRMGLVNVGPCDFLRGLIELGLAAGLAFGFAQKLILLGWFGPHASLVWGVLACALTAILYSFYEVHPACPTRSLRCIGRLVGIRWIIEIVISVYYFLKSGLGFRIWCLFVINAGAYTTPAFSCRRYAESFVPAVVKTLRLGDAETVRKQSQSLALVGVGMVIFSGFAFFAYGTSTAATLTTEEQTLRVADENRNYDRIDGKFSEVDQAEAQEQQSLCESGNKYACHKKCKRTSDDRERAVCYRQACELGAKWSCYNLGDIYEKGQLGTPDLAQAQRFFRTSCELGLLRACRRGAIQGSSP